MGGAGLAKVEEFIDQSTKLGGCLKRLTELESDIREAMQISGLTPEMAYKANEILEKNPISFSVLPDDKKECVTTYWIKKKACIAILIDKKGYTLEELCSNVCYTPNNNQ